MDIPDAASFTELLKQLEMENVGYMDSIFTSAGGGVISVIFIFLVLILKNKMCKKSKCAVDSYCFKASIEDSGTETEVATA